MTNAETLRVIAVLTAYFRQELSDETAVLWAQELTDYEVVDGLEAARYCGTSNRFMPSLREFTDAILAARYARLSKTATLPEPAGEVVSLADFVKANPEYRDRLRKIGGLVGEALQAEADA